jgi:hypothetical protein
MKQPTTPAEKLTAPNTVGSGVLLGDRIWSKSIREEIIAALWLIAALLAWHDNIKWLAWFLFIKSASDTLTAIIYAFREAIAEVNERRSPNADIRHAGPGRPD